MDSLRKACNDRELQEVDRAFSLAQQDGIFVGKVDYRRRFGVEVSAVDDDFDHMTIEVVDGPWVGDEVAVEESGGG